MRTNGKRRSYQKVSTSILVSTRANESEKQVFLGMAKYKLNGTFYYCPVDLTLQIVGGRWKGIVIWNLRDGSLRFSELKRRLVTINDKMLAQVLRDLEGLNVVQRTVVEVTPPKVTYCLTAEGIQLLPIMQEMNNYGAKYALTTELT